MIRFGVVGTGPFFQGSHLPTLIASEDIQITGVYNRGRENRAQTLGILNKAGILAQLYDDPYTLCQSASVDAVLLCMPPELHPSLTECALRAGKHVFCEKPVAVSLDEARRVADAASTAASVFHVGFVIRYSYLFSELQKIIEDGKIGDPKMVWCRCYSDSDWPYRESSWANDPNRSGGSLNSWAVHPLDLMQGMARAYPVQCAAQGGHMARQNTVNTDGAFCTVRYENGVIGSLQFCRFAPRGDDWWIGCIGTHGMVEAGFFARRMYLRTDSGVEEVQIPPYTLHSFDGMVQQMGAFLEAVQDKKSTFTGYREGYYATAAALALEQSMRNDMFVSIPQI